MAAIKVRPSRADDRADERQAAPADLPARDPCDRRLRLRYRQAGSLDSRGRRLRSGEHRRLRDRRHGPGLEPVGEGRRAARPLSWTGEAARGGPQGLARRRPDLGARREARPRRRARPRAARLQRRRPQLRLLHEAEGPGQVRPPARDRRRPAGAPRDRRLDRLRRQPPGARQLRAGARGRRHARRRAGVPGRHEPPARRRSPARLCQRRSVSTS